MSDVFGEFSELFILCLKGEVLAAFLRAEFRESIEYSFARIKLFYFVLIGQPD
jgi:hypothetical protein